LIKPLLLFVETIFMTINKIAQTVFDSFDNTDIVLAILNHNGTYVANKLDIFEQVFSDSRLLDELCRRVDDGQEPLISQVDGFLVAASGLSNGLKNIGYAIMLLPADSTSSPQADSFKSVDSTPSAQLRTGLLTAGDFIEIILEQFSTIAGLIEANRQLRDASETAESRHFAFEMPSLTALN